MGVGRAVHLALIVEAVTTDESLRITTADVYGSLTLTRTELVEHFGPRAG